VRFSVREETLAAWERGQAQPSPRHYGALVALLGYDPAPTKAGLPARLNAARRRLGLTQAELAARLGLDEGTVADLERGARRVSRRVREMIERFVTDDGTL
jgi:transcriptional regulator with XRE-family HTH domain